MTMPNPRIRIAFLAAFAATPYVLAQAPAIATVSRSDATVIGAHSTIAASSTASLDITGDSTITALDHTAPVTLARGGQIHLCQTSALHLIPGAGDALLMALDRGSMEVRGQARAGDVVETPDLRITLADPAPLDLDLRVSGNGDTCIDNRGHHAPTLNLSESFGDAAYVLKPGQHVTFEHGSLHQVVDRETVPCGCPPADSRNDSQDLRRGSLADAALAGGSTSSTPAKPATPATPAQAAAAAHPFPMAESEGLAPPAPIPAEKPGETHVQVATNLHFDPNAPAQPPADQTVASATPPPAPTSQPQTKHNPFQAIGHFFKSLFVR